MAKGTQKGSKGAKKKSAKKVDPFSRKEWYNVRSPAMFKLREIGKTLVNRSIANKLASDSLKGRVFECSLADLQKDEVCCRKFKLVAEDVQGKNLLTNFHGMSLTTDKLRSMIKKWQTLIQAHVDVRTTDGYLLRFFVIGFTKKSTNQLKKTCYAKRTQVKKIRRIMRAYIIRKVRQSDLKSVVSELIPDAFAHTIEKKCAKVYPLHDVMVRKVKVLKKPKIDMARLLELHDETRTVAVDSTTGAPATEGVKIDRPDGYEPPVLANV